MNGNTGLVVPRINETMYLGSCKFGRKPLHTQIINNDIFADENSIEFENLFKWTFRKLNCIEVCTYTVRIARLYIFLPKFGIVWKTL
jgi:hypothetical protein